MSELNSPGGRLAPELLAPAGNWECAKAAVENGADAIYFGLQVGFNARARAANFATEDLEQLMAMLHRRGVRGYVTLNTLVFTDELPALEKNVRFLAASGVDAVLVQDLGAARLIRQICSDLPIHASTQMTMTCHESIEVAKELGIERVVLARELSIAEMAKISASTDMPLEAFVHGALCVAYSGQCLTSESLGGRSANRGQCAQACRLNYDLLCDNKPYSTGDMKYLLSPQDLAGYELVPKLIEAGICSLKIEGRLKTPEYVANVVHHYRQAIDDAMQGNSVRFTEQSQREMELSFSRGFSPGWLEGNNHKRLVPGTSSAKRGVLIGEVLKLRGERLEVQLTSPIQAGDGIVLDGNRLEGKEVGGRIYQVFQNGTIQEGPAQGQVELLFQRGLLKDKPIYPGQRIWLTDDPRLTKRLRSTFESQQPLRRLPIDIACTLQIDRPIELRVQCDDGKSIMIQHPHCPVPAEKHPMDHELLMKQLGRLGGSAYALRNLSATIDSPMMVPLSVLGELRKTMITTLDHYRTQIATRTFDEAGTTERMLQGVEATHRSANPVPTTTAASEPAASLHVLCRTLHQLQQALECGAKSLYADFHDLRDYKEAVAQAKQFQASISLATLRIHKPGERGLFLALAKNHADGWLVRNLAALQFAHAHSIPFICDFSLNVTNPLTAEFLMQHGAQRVTASYDLNRDQLVELINRSPADWFEVVVHQHMPMFHMEHCVFCSVLSPGTNKTNCGRPCDRHEVRLRDRIGVEHVLQADIGCRNTLYNGVPQSGAEVVAPLLRQGVQHYRIELLRDSSTEETQRTIRLYQDLLAGKIAGSEVWKSLKAHNRVGVTRGTLEQPRNPMAVL